MNSLLVKTPSFVRHLSPNRLWSFPKDDNSVYLTFDDGPVPEVTPWVLDTLAEFNARATFFCIGNNVNKHPELFSRIISEGHTVGNHTFNHLNGWKTDTATYISDCNATSEIMATLLSEEHSSAKRLFRPPYGKISNTQARKIQEMGYKVVMWDVLSFDWDRTITSEKCLDNVSKNTETGSIVVFHDSLKAEKHLRFVLPEFLKLISERGWECKAI